MSDENGSAERLEGVREVMRDWETYPMRYDPEFARTYAGQWVALYRGRVVAHGEKGSEVAQATPAGKHPGVTLFRVPTAEQREGVWILKMRGPGA